jgi:rhodanese-related sulfurtransferase
VDVRNAEAFAGGHLGSARNFPGAAIADGAKQLEKWKDKPIVVYCDTGLASGTAARHLQMLGFTIVKNLRAANYAVNISSSARTGNTVTLTVASHDFLVGDVVTVANVSTSGRTSLNQAGVTISNTTSTTITYTNSTSGTLALASTNGDIGLDSADTLVVDTYNKSALLNGSATYARSYIDAVVDWITLAPGENTIGFTDSGGTTDMTVEHRSGWIG